MGVVCDVGWIDGLSSWWFDLWVWPQASEQSVGVAGAEGAGPKLTKRRLSLGRKSMKKPPLRAAHGLLDASAAAAAAAAAAASAAAAVVEAPPRRPPPTTPDVSDDDEYQEVQQHYQVIKSHVVALEVLFYRVSTEFFGLRLAFYRVFTEFSHGLLFDWVNLF